MITGGRFRNLTVPKIFPNRPLEEDENQSSFSLGVVTGRVVSCRVVSCRVVSCRVVSCRVVSCLVFLFPSLVLSCLT
jgi:hypothetical protein